MLIGIPKEIKKHEHRVSITPGGVRELVHHGHQAVVETQAGLSIGYDDAAYQDAGALVVDTPEEVFQRAEMIVKVKEPQLEECAKLKESQILFSYLHLAAEPQMTNELIDSGCIAVAFETVTAEDGTLPLLAPMSEVAGRIAVQAGATALEKKNGGRGVLLSGVPGVARGDVTVIGGGVVGTNAALIAAQMGANVTILERSIERIRTLEWQLGSQVRCIYSTADSLEQHVNNSDLIVGAVLIPGAAAPKLVKRNQLANMRPGAVIVDVAIDQGGCFETSKATSHDEPTYNVEGIVHYCVSNMPSAVARTSTQALENTILPYILRLAGNGYRSTFKEDKHFCNGLNIYRGRVTHEAVAKDLNHSFVPPATFL